MKEFKENSRSAQLMSEILSPKKWRRGIEKEGEGRKGAVRGEKGQGLLVSSGDGFRTQRDRSLLGRGISRKFWVLGSGRALYHGTVFLRAARAQNIQGHIIRALWVQAQQEGGPGVRAGWPKASMANIQTPQHLLYKVTRVPTPPSSSHFHSHEGHQSISGSVAH